jgi:integrase/recombinase XerD
LTIKNLVFDENGVIITIPEGKTGARRIRVVFAASSLREWLDVHPTKENRESPAFVSLREPYHTLSDTGLMDQLNKIAKKARIQKRINAHSFRHARATHLAEHLTEQQLKKYFGGTEGSNMAAVYVHLSGKDIDNAILKLNGIQIDDTHAAGLQVGRCPRCHDLNHESTSYCGKCGLPLKDSAREQLEQGIAAVDMAIMKAIATDPSILDEITERLNKFQNNKKHLEP